MQSQFQVFIDTATGGFLHIDTERCFDGNERSLPNHVCQRKLQGYVDLLLRSRGGRALPAQPCVRGARAWRARLRNASDVGPERPHSYCTQSVEEGTISSKTDS